ncbi:hypothetical protein F4809DRAFT_640506 [Biscogniauxia mediterranea]|nr:hypothetical protein F4809DRAFT_640506 [Biscogniauxia mediterranea]
MLSLSGLTVEIVQVVGNFDLSNIHISDQVGHILSTKLNTDGSGSDDVDQQGWEHHASSLSEANIWDGQLSYTLSELIPALAAVEYDHDHALDAPPAYERVSLKGDVGKTEADETGIVRLRPLTSSLRVTLYPLYSISGCASFLRGLGHISTKVLVVLATPPRLEDHVRGGCAPDTDKLSRGGDRAWIALVLVLLLVVILVIPSHVVLTRVQASLLPADTKIIVPFRRPCSRQTREDAHP